MVAILRSQHYGVVHGTPVNRTLPSQASIFDTSRFFISTYAISTPALVV